MCRAKFENGIAKSALIPMKENGGCFFFLFEFAISMVELADTGVVFYEESRHIADLKTEREREVT